MAGDVTTPRSRRALLAAAGGAAAALVVAAVERPLAVTAADGDVVHVGEEHHGVQPTQFTADRTALTANMVGGDDETFALWATAGSGGGVFGAGRFFGVKGESGEGKGVYGESGTGTAVEGASYGSIGVLGKSDAGAGVVGRSRKNTGVKGSSEAGIGVEGLSEQVAPGVRGYNHSYTAVQGETESGNGVHARARDAVHGTALRVDGKARFSRSGKAIVRAGRSYVTVSLLERGGLGGTPLCFANLQRYRSGVFVAAVRPNYPSVGKLRIYLNKVVTSDIAVAWLVLG